MIEITLDRHIRDSPAQCDQLMTQLYEPGKKIKIACWQ